MLLRAMVMLDQTRGEVRWLGSPVPPDQIPLLRGQLLYLQQRAMLPDGTVRAALQEPFSWRANQVVKYFENQAVEWSERLGRPHSFFGNANQ